MTTRAQGRQELAIMLMVLAALAESQLLVVLAVWVGTVAWEEKEVTGSGPVGVVVPQLVYVMRLPCLWALIPLFLAQEVQAVQAEQTPLSERPPPAHLEWESTSFFNENAIWVRGG